jgi:3-oxoadipate CoA-transferase alpha subunit
MINKIVRNTADALGDLCDGAVILVGGFGEVGQPGVLIDALIEQGARDLVVVSNNAGVGRSALSRLFELDRVRQLICSFARSSGPAFQELYRAGRLELEIVPQGTLAERLRAASAGIPAFYTPASVGTIIADKKEVRIINGRRYVLEYALPGDVALISGWKSDRWGNLVYKQAARNFNPIMASAGKTTIAQVDELVELGSIDPEVIVTPGVYVDRVVCARSSAFTR